MRTFLQEPGSGRFRLSDNDLPVVESQLISVNKISSYVTIDSQGLIVDGLLHEDQTEEFKYVIDFEHFKIS